MKTTPRVSFGLYNLTTKQDSTPSSSSDLQTFSKVDDLRTDNVSGRPYATYEPDFWLLDGGYKFLPSDDDLIHVGLMSLDQSDASGEFSTPPVLTISFAEEHTIDSLTIHFSPYTGDYADDIDISYYNTGAVLIRSDSYAPTSTDFSTGQEVNNFAQIVITFNSTHRAYRYLRVTGIDYGTLITFEGSGVLAASVIEDTDPISAELKGNTAEVKLYSTTADFNMLNPAGYYAKLTERQPISIYELMNGAPVFIGQYYLDTWENPSNTTILFKCVDLVGLMEHIFCYGGLWTGSGIAVETLIEDLLGGASIPYELDSVLNGTMVIGWLPAGTLREALQQIAFAVGASVDCSRSRSVKIYASKIASTATATATLTKAQKGTEQSLTMRPVIAGVEMTAHSYVNGSEARELYNGSLAAGTYEILFTQPMHTLVVSGATIAESGANYAILTVSSPGTVTLSGSLVVDTTQVYKITNSAVTGSIKTALRITDATLVNPSNMATVAQRVYDYHIQRYLQKAKLYAPVIEVGQCVSIDTLYGAQIRGVVESLSIDLAGGMIAQAEIIGVEDA